MQFLAIVGLIALILLGCFFVGVVFVMNREIEELKERVDQIDVYKPKDE